MAGKNGLAYDLLDGLYADYVQAEQSYNCLISNWEWFEKSSCRSYNQLLSRMEQN